MKASRLILAVIVTSTLAFTGCQRLEELFNRDEVRFSSRTSGCGLALTRAEYSGSTYTENDKTFYNIVWEVGDGISIGSEEASEKKSLKYTVATVSQDGKISKATLTKDTDIGIRWGADGKYTFYAVYPSTELFNVSGTVNLKFPTAQVQGDGSVWDGDTYVVKPNPDYMFMTSTAVVDYKASAITSPLVDLDFKFFPTVMDFTLSGENDMTIKKIGLESSSQYLSGMVNLNLNDLIDGFPSGTITDPDMSKSVSISTVDDNGNPIVIEKGKKIRVCLFLSAYYESKANKTIPDVTNLKFKVTFVTGDEEHTLTTDLKMRENESSDYEFLSFKPHLRHIIKGLILPDTIEWSVEGNVVVTPWNETGEVHTPEFTE